MNCCNLRYLLLGVPVLALLVVLGCSTPTNPPKDEGTEGPKPTGMKELASTGWGTLTGKVTLDGPAPDIEKLNTDLKSKMETGQNKEHCLMAPPEQRSEYVWTIKDGAVKNVFVWLRPPEGTYFKIPEEALKKASDETASVDQPFCAFVPHALTLFPSHYDGKSKKQVPTGQKFVIKNSAPINHNTKVTIQDEIVMNPTLPPNGKEEVKQKDLKPSYTQPATLSCSIHGWMEAKIWIFDHPFAAVTDDNGNYKIENVPTGVDLQIVAWHEGAPGGGWITPNKTKGATIKLDKETTKDFKVKAQ